MDRALDVVAWRDFNDQSPGKLLLFGQCASGNDWDKAGKLAELNPQEFFEEFMMSVPASPFVKAYFIPHRVERRYWTYYTRHSGMIFDRCRIASWIPKTTLESEDNSDVRVQCEEWVKSKLVV